MWKWTCACMFWWKFSWVQLDPLPAFEGSYAPRKRLGQQNWQLQLPTMRSPCLPAGTQHDRIRPSGRPPDPGCRYRTRSLCCSTCHRCNAPHPRTGSFPWRRYIHHSTDQHASLWFDPEREQHSQIKVCLAKCVQPGWREWRNAHWNVRQDKEEPRS